MFQTKFGARSLTKPYKSSEVASTLTTPAIGQLVTLKAPTLAQSLSKKQRSLQTTADTDLGKLQLASAAGGGSPELDGMIVQIIQSAASGIDSIVVAAPGEVVPLWYFGSLTTLQGFGYTNILWLSSTTPGAVEKSPPGPGNFARRVARLPKMCVNLEASDLDPQNPLALYVMLIEERALPV